MTKQEKKKMSALGDELRAIAARVDKMAESPVTPSPDQTPVSVPPGPETPATPNPAPRDNAPALPAQVSLLIISALSEARKLRGASPVISRLEELKAATSDEKRREAIQIALGESQLLKEDHLIDSRALTAILMQISALVGGSDSVIVGDTNVGGDMEA